MNLLLLLLAYLTLGATGGAGAGGEGADAEGGAGGPGEDDPNAASDEETLDDLIELAEGAGDAAAAPDPKESAALKEARRRTQETENQLNQERAARQAAEARAAPAQRFVDPDFEREEQELAAARTSGQTPEQLSWLAWKIDGNRKIRDTQRASFGALAQAQDLQDRTAFERLEITQPKFFKRYAARVEAAMNEMRARGQNAPRLAVLRLLIGDDIMNGTIKPKPRAAAAPVAGGVDRGRTPNARSDVGAKGKQSEHDKRIARLENQRI